MYCPRIDHFIRLNKDGSVGKCGHMINAKGFGSYEELEQVNGCQAFATQWIRDNGPWSALDANAQRKSKVKASGPTALQDTRCYIQSRTTT